MSVFTRFLSPNQQRISCNRHHGYGTANPARPSLHPLSARAKQRRGLTGDDYLDLAEAVERGAIARREDAEPDPLRARYTIAFGSWEAMLGQLLGQLAADAGTARRALILLGVPALLLDAWEQGPIVATDKSANWVGARRVDPLRRLVLTSRVRARRGDDYLDLAEAAGSMALAGDGALEAARLRARYTVERGPWLRMVADLLGQLVADAGSVERASSVLGVAPHMLRAWVRWLVSRGSPYAAAARWPVAPVGDTPDAGAYLDLAEVVERGTIEGDNNIAPPEVREFYVIEFDSWARMAADLLSQVTADAGSIRKAAKLLDVPRATLGSWTKRGRLAKP